MTKRLTEKKVVDAIEGTGGTSQAIADRLGVTRRTVENWKSKSERVRDSVLDERNRGSDIAESKLLSAVEAGSAWAIKFWLTTLAKDRGYTTRSEQEITSTTAGDVVLYLPRNGREAADGEENDETGN